MVHSLPSQTDAERSLDSAIYLNSSDKIALDASQTVSLAVLWAKKYVNTVTAGETAAPIDEAWSETIDSSEGRSRTADQLLRTLTSASAAAWSLTENLLAAQALRHQIDPAQIDPWQIAADSHALFQTALQAYADRVTPQRLSVLVSGEFGRVRQHYTAADPRVLGFVSLQFHYTGSKLLEARLPQERLLLTPYLKVMDDHLYMPLRAAYEAAADHAIDSPVLAAAQHLLAESTTIAHAVCRHISRTHPAYQSYSGALTLSTVRTSSIRDVEMFQVYLCLCVLAGSVRSVQQELFPLCVMLYPPLGVSWRLVQEMLTTLAWEMHDRLTVNDIAIFLPYLRMLTEMFSPEVFG